MSLNPPVYYHLCASAIIASNMITQCANQPTHGLSGTNVSPDGNGTVMKAFYIAMRRKISALISPALHGRL